MNCNNHECNWIHDYEHFLSAAQVLKPCDLISPCLDEFFMQVRCRSGGDDACVFARDYADVGGG